ncbi:exosortase/archaeosortase family protein [Jiangella endophytica]|uniref:exosortase/archaeosortase family protein n=1 Tax=Jiangella endophytica TaxID=1623398 RepID=UPI0013006E24|nr:exosortase/archaeosortase family protein [Jiangella endophytica]
MSAVEVRAVSAPLPSSSRVVRLVLAAGLVLLGAHLVLNAAAFRLFEARLAGLVTGAVLDREVRTMTAQPAFVFERVAGDESTWFALHITSQCSALFFLVPLALVAAFVLLSGRSTIPTLVVAVLAAGVLLELVNLARIEALVLVVVHGDPSMFRWVHDTVGSAAMLGGFTIALLVFFRLGFFGRRARGRHAPEAGGTT